MDDRDGYREKERKRERKRERKSQENPRYKCDLIKMMVYPWLGAGIEAFLSFVRALGRSTTICFVQNLSSDG